MPIGRRPTEAELSAIQAHASDATADNVLVYQHLMVGDQIVPRRFLRLHPEHILARFKMQTEQGLPWIFDHNYWNPVTLGRAFAAQLVKEPATALVEAAGELVERPVEATHLYGLYYMPLGIELAQGAPHATTDKMAQAINLGLSRDTSIGFGLGKYECSLCKNDIRDWENCPHYPGETYEWEGKQRICIVDGIGGDIIEQSSVFRGAYPIAGIQRQSAALPDAGNLEAVADAELKTLPMDAQVFHTFGVRGGLQTYVPVGTKRRNVEALSATDAGVNKPEPAPPAAVDPAETNPEGTPETQATPTDPTPVTTQTVTVTLGDKDFKLQIAPSSVDTAEALVTALNEEQNRLAAEGNDAKEALTTERTAKETAEQALSDAQGRLRTALGLTPEQDPVAEAERLAPDLQDTRTYREHLVAESLAMGVRAYGNTFPSERWGDFLRAPGRSIAELRNQLQAFEAETRKRIPAGRLSVPMDPPDFESAPAPQDDHTYTIRQQAGK